MNALGLHERWLRLLLNEATGTVGGMLIVIRVVASLIRCKLKPNPLD